jgi:ankyrin repeat protein
VILLLLHPYPLTMPLLQLPSELILMIAPYLIEDHILFGRLNLKHLKSFRQVNRGLYACLNALFWQETLQETEYATEDLLMNAINSGNVERLKFLLDLGVNVETPLESFFYAETEDTPSPLVATASLDNVPMARLLLEKGARVQYPHRYSPMHAALSAEMVQLFLDFGADPDLWVSGTPLHHYINRDNLGAMRAVLQRGAEVNPVVGRALLTPLHWAAHSGSVEAVKILLKFGGDVKKKDQAWYTPLHFAAGQGNTEVARLLLERCPEGIREKTVELKTPLHLAAKAGKTEVARLLMERWPVGVRKEDKALDTPLHLAATEGKIEVARLLVESWPEGMKARNECLDTPLHMAAKGGDSRAFNNQPGTLEVAKLLAEGWPDGIGEKNKNSDTPLHVAAQEGETEMVKLFVERWPESLKAKNANLNTPLHLAVTRVKLEAVRLLVDSGPKGMKERNKDSDTPLHLAAKGGLFRRQPSMLGVVKLLVGRWPEGVRERNENLDTPLHVAAGEGETEMVKVFAESWPEGMRAKNKDGWTPCECRRRAWI